MSIHPTAIIEDGAELHPSAEIGPYCVVGPNVRLGANTLLRPHAHVTGHTEIGAGTQIFSFASVGEVPQDLKYAGEPTRLVIGERNVIREYVTLHPGTAAGGGTTTLGDDNLLMIGVHVAHDCHLGSNVILSNNALLAGHVTVEDYAVIAADTAIHQFARVGESAMLSAKGGLRQDLAPYVLADGMPARPIRVNRVNLERRGLSEERIHALERAFRLIFRSGLRPRDAFARVREELADSPEAEHMVAFLEKSERGFARMR